MRILSSVTSVCLQAVDLELAHLTAGCHGRRDHMRQVGAKVRAKDLRQVRKQPVRVLPQLAEIELQTLHSPRLTSVRKSLTDLKLKTSSISSKKRYVED